MKWEKKGRIFCPSGQFEFMNSYTSPINAVVLDDRIRVFFSSRAKPDNNGNFISYPCYIDLDRDKPQNVINMCCEPILKSGNRGMFDEYGIMVYKSVWNNGKLYLYYGGWQRMASKEAPYQVLLGLAISEDGGYSFNKVSEGPVMGTDIYDPLSIGNVYVVIKDGIWYMYYTTYKRWEFNGVKATPEYNIKLATSKDGIHWAKENRVIIEENEKGGIATPCIFEHDGKYKMLFGYRKPYEENGMPGSYRIGYAESYDLLNWSRRDEEVGIDLSAEGWDSEMICYPDIVKINNKILMFYCGNGYGKSGFGYAELQKEDVGEK